MKVDLDGTSSPRRLQHHPAGFTIHSAIHQVREAPAACSICTRWTARGRELREGLLPLNQTAQFVTHDLAYHDYEGVALDPWTSVRAAKDLGNKNHMLLRNHGTLTVGRSVGLGVRADVPPGASLLDAGAHPHARACRLSGRASVIDKNSEMFGNPTARELRRPTWLAAAIAKARPDSRSSGIEILGCWCNI